MGDSNESQTMLTMRRPLSQELEPRTTLYHGPYPSHTDSNKDAESRQSHVMRILSRPDHVADVIERGFESDGVLAKDHV